MSLDIHYCVVDTPSRQLSINFYTFKYTMKKIAW